MATGRVAALVMGQVDMRPEWVEPVAVASYYHDAAIWFEHTWDYLPGRKALRRRSSREPATRVTPRSSPR